MRRNRVDTQLVVVALRGFEQGRIDARARHLFEDFLAARLFHRYRRPPLAIEIEGQAADLLAVEQGKLQLALEQAGVGIVEGHLDSGSCQAADDHHVDIDARQSYRLRRFRDAQDERSRRRRKRIADRRLLGSQELQESIEQPARCRAQSGRLALKAWRPGCSS
jgi:hypothetical protein